MLSGMWHTLAIVLITLGSFPASSHGLPCSLSQAPTVEVCPELNLTIIDDRLNRIPADGSQQLLQICGPTGNASLCCDGFGSVMKLLLSHYLAGTGFFRLPTMSVATACWSSIVDRFGSSATLNLSTNCTQFCGYQASDLVRDPGFCAASNASVDMTLQQIDTSFRVDIERSCNRSLAYTQVCAECEQQVYSLSTEFQILSTSSSTYAAAAGFLVRCFTLAVEYALGVQTSANDATVDCILGFSSAGLLNATRDYPEGGALGGPGGGGTGPGSPNSTPAGGTGSNKDTVDAATRPKDGNEIVSLRDEGKGRGWGFYSIVGVGSLFGTLLILLVVLLVLYRDRIEVYRSAADKRFERRTSHLLEPRIGPSGHHLAWFPYDEIKAATNNFAKDNAIGEGGFGTVFKGTLKDGTMVAVKRFKNSAPESDPEFLNEVDVISSVRHRNLVLLRGCSVKGDTKDGHQRLLVYDFMPNGSLSQYLFSGKNPVLDWNTRIKILIGTGRGISYLHRGAQPSIIHRDIKMSNILLDESLNARVADFGLAKFNPEGMTHMTTRVAGTFGFVAPEYALYGQLTEKSDVYSFGVVLLELVSGRKALKTVDGSFTSSLISDWAWSLLQEGRVREVIDSRIRESVPVEEVERVVRIGLLCAHLQANCRPNMVQALQMLEGDVSLPEVFPDRPLQLTSDTSRDDTSSFVSDSTVSHYTDNSRTPQSASASYTDHSITACSAGFTDRSNSSQSATFPDSATITPPPSSPTSTTRRPVTSPAASTRRPASPSTTTRPFSPTCGARRSSSPSYTYGTSSPSSTRRPSSPSSTKRPSSPTSTKRPSSPTSTKRPSSPTSTKRPSSPTSTKRPSSPTSTKRPSSPTSSPSDRT